MPQKKISEIYQEELERNGGDLDMVQVLSPLRAKTEAGVTALNNRLQELPIRLLLIKRSGKPSTVCSVLVIGLCRRIIQKRLLMEILEGLSRLENQKLGKWK